METQTTLFTEYPASIKVVANYLRSAFPNAELAESEDLDRDGIRFRIEPRRLVFVSHEFLSDFPSRDAAAHLRELGVAEKVKTLPVGFMLFVTTEGTFIERVR